MEEVSATVREWLGSARLSPAAAARRAGVSPSTMHRILNALVDPSVGTLNEIALACGIQFGMVARPLSDSQAAAAARVLLEESYDPPPEPGVAAWQQRLQRMAAGSSPVDIVQAAAAASRPLHRSGAVLFQGEVPLARVASAGDASQGRWAISGAAGLYLPSPSTSAPAATILWCENVRTVVHLLAETELQQTQRQDRTVLAVIAAEPELFSGSFADGIIDYAAPIQIILDCLSQSGAVADNAVQEARSW